MIEIRIPKEITEYKEKIFLGLTLRQILSLVAMVLINVPAYFMLKDVIGIDMTSWVIMMNAAPIAVVGFVKISGMPFEQFAKVFVITNFVYPQNRKYKTENIYEILANEIQKAKDDAVRVDFVKAEREEREMLQRQERERRAEEQRKRKMSASLATTEKTPAKQMRVKAHSKANSKAYDKEHGWKEKEFVGAHLREQRTEENREVNEHGE